MNQNIWRVSFKRGIYFSVFYITISYLLSTTPFFFIPYMINSSLLNLFFGLNNKFILSEGNIALFGMFFVLVIVFAIGFVMNYLRETLKRKGVPEITLSTDTFWKRSGKLVLASIVSVIVLFAVIFIVTYLLVLK